MDRADWQDDAFAAVEAEFIDHLCHLSCLNIRVDTTRQDLEKQILRQSQRIRVLTVLVVLFGFLLSFRWIFS